eukprot:10978381-Ditylum_brightwellii.AAC.1
MDELRNTYVLFKNVQERTYSMDRQDGWRQSASICGHMPLEQQSIWAILFLICQMDHVPYPCFPALMNNQG